MNKTDKAKLDVARRMLKGKIEVDEVVLMTGLDKKTIEDLNEEINPLIIEGRSTFDVQLYSKTSIMLTLTSDSFCTTTSRPKTRSLKVLKSLNKKHAELF